MRNRTHNRCWKGLLLGATVAALITISQAEAAEREVTITSREIVEKLARLEEGQKRLEQRIDGVEATLNRRIDEITQFMLWGFGVTFSGLFILMGFVIWDRRTAISPVMRRTEQIEAALR